MRATLQQYKDFLDSAVWIDIKEVLLLRRSSIRDELERGANLSGSALLEWEERQRGRADELRFLADYPQYMVDNYDTMKGEEDE